MGFIEITFTNCICNKKWFHRVPSCFLSNCNSFSKNNTKIFTNLDKEVLDICSTKCKPDCNTKQYLTEIKVLDINKPWVQSARVNFQHNSIPDIIVRHTLEMSLMSFVCNFGGLLGMWLGFSVLSISKHIFETIYQVNENPINSFAVEFEFYWNGFICFTFFTFKDIFETIRRLISFDGNRINLFINNFNTFNINKKKLL